jgi:hypothetical protein
MNAGPNERVTSACPVAATNLVRKAAGGYLPGPPVDQLRYIPVGSGVRELRLLNAVWYRFPEGCADGAARESPEDWADGVTSEFPAARVAGTLAAACADAAAAGWRGPSRMRVTLAGRRIP